MMSPVPAVNIWPGSTLSLAALETEAAYGESGESTALPQRRHRNAAKLQLLTRESSRKATRQIRGRWEPMTGWEQINVPPDREPHRKAAFAAMLHEA